MFSSTKLLEEIFKSGLRFGKPFPKPQFPSIHFLYISYKIYFTQMSAEVIFLVQNNYKMVTAGLSFLKIFQ